MSGLNVAEVVFPKSEKRYEYSTTNPVVESFPTNLFGVVECHKQIDAYDFQRVDELVKGIFNSQHFKVVRIKAIKPMSEQQFFGTIKPLVAVFDASAYIDRLRRTQQLCQLEIRMQERAERAEKIARMKKLAEHDPEMADMVKQYTMLTSVGENSLPAPDPVQIQPVTKDTEDIVKDNQAWFDMGYIEGKAGKSYSSENVPFTYTSPYRNGWLAGSAEYRADGDEPVQIADNG